MPVALRCRDCNRYLAPGGSRAEHRSGRLHPVEGGLLDDAPQATVSCRNVWKVYGPKADRIVGTPDADLPRGELLEKTGCVAAVRDVSFDVAKGEVFVVMGLSGSGKSTLVRMLNRLHDPTAGHVLVDGEDLVQLDED
jgi:glycine betaine/proline transport system ATP-binding protein